LSKFHLKDRRFVTYILFILGSAIILGKLMALQLFSNEYKDLAERNVMRKEMLYPVRGSIFDRNGELLVANQRSYDLMVIPRMIKDLDTTRFCQLIDLSKERLDKKLKRAKRYSPFLPSILIKDLKKAQGVTLREQMHHFRGFFLQERTAREYPVPTAANVLGYISQVPKSVLENDDYYRKNDNIGRTGVEKSYEEALRGVRGEKYVLRDQHNRTKGAFREGNLDIPPVPGKDLSLTIDVDLQQYAEQLMSNKKGSVVAIEPETGEILALATSPGFDPNMLVGRDRSKNYTILYNDTLQPLYDRSLQGLYPPGSTFKLINALIGLQEGVISPATSFKCDHGWYFSPKLKVGCHPHKSPLDLKNAIAQSCNAYFCYEFRRILEKSDNISLDYQKWYDHVRSFGLGDYLNNDLYVGKKGLVPSVAYNDARMSYRWKAPSIISMAIGQGELLVTPIQMANMCAALANRGYYYTPHIVKAINGDPIDVPNFKEKKFTSIDSRYFETVVDAMHMVVEDKKGTAREARIPGIEICGKTGTAENSHGEDHSIFIAFAPKENPKIALAVYVENAGWGSTYGVPIASLLVEKYLTDTIARPDLEQKMISANLLEVSHEK
jgi:penicillin-binding protein 2